MSRHMDLEQRSPQLPLGIEVLYSYVTHYWEWLCGCVSPKHHWILGVSLKKVFPIARMEVANFVPPITADFIMSKPWTEKMSDEERQKALMEKLDLTGLHRWDEDLTTKARNLLMEYHDLFSLEKSEIGWTKTVEHTIVLKDPNTTPFKERFHRIPPPQVEEVREHLKLILEVGAIWLSNSTWCNAVVLMCKKDGSLWFCIDFRKLNSLTPNDSHPLPHIGETLDSLVGSAIYSTFDLLSGFWQVPMAEESKQFTAFTLGSMGLFECDRMPLCLCNAPATFQRLMQNCLGKLNLTYCLIYLDDIIVYSKDPKQHLERMQVVFECLLAHGLKLKPSKCDLFKSQIIYNNNNNNNSLFTLVYIHNACMV